MRLNKFIQKSGITSRRKADILIKSGKIKVNNQIITQPFWDINIKKDIVKYEEKILTIIEKKIYIKLYKGINVFSTRKDKYAKKTIYDFIPENLKNIVFPVGRLDKNSEGLIILTNDGNFAYKITHPKFNIKKHYLVILNKFLNNDIIEKILKGIEIKGKIIKPIYIKQRNDIKDIIKKYKYLNIDKEKNLIYIILTDGIKREIREIFKKFNYKVIRLIRIQIDNIKLYNLKEGEYKYFKI